jgi:hypothetical protein
LIHRSRLTVASAALLAALALAGLLLMPVCGLRAASCADGCRAAYGSCYKSSQDRAKCQAQLQRCLEGCIRGQR